MRSTSSRTGSGPRWTSRMGAGFSCPRAHPVSQFADLLRMDALVRDDRSIGHGGRPVRDVEGPDQAADGEAGGGVLVHVDGRFGVPEQLSGLAPAVQPLGHVTVRSREQASGRRVADAAGSQAPSAEGQQPQRPPHRGWADHQARVHRSIVGGGHWWPTGGIWGPPRSRWPPPTTSRCSISTGSSTSAGRQFRAPPSTSPTPAGPAYASRSSPTTPPGPPTTSPPTCASSASTPAPTTWSHRPRRRRGCCATGSARGPPWPCWVAAGSMPRFAAETLVPVSVGDDAVALVSGYGPDVLWRDVMRAAVLVRDGLPWVASNTDLTIPTTYGTAPGHGVLVGLLREFTGVRADSRREAGTAAARRDDPPGGREPTADGGRPARHRHRRRDQRRLRQPAGDDRGDRPGPAGGGAGGTTPDLRRAGPGRAARGARVARRWRTEEPSSAAGEHGPTGRA